MNTNGVGETYFRCFPHHCCTYREYCNQNKLLPCIRPAVLMLDSCMQGGISTIASTAGSFSANWINICCAAQNVRDLKKCTPREQKSRFADSAFLLFIRSLSLSLAIFFDPNLHMCARVWSSDYVSCLSTCVSPCAAWDFSVAGSSCEQSGYLRSICIYDGCRAPVVWANSTEGFPRAWREGEELSQTQTDSFWCPAMKPVGDPWPHPNMRLAEVEDGTFSFF